MALGLGVAEPETACSDPNCPFHGELSVRGQTVVGRVASTSMERTAVVEREYDVKVPKYDRYMKRRSRVPAHHPPCLEIEVGDAVRIAETRPLSKTKSHTVVERVAAGTELDRLEAEAGPAADELAGDEAASGTEPEDDEAAEAATPDADGTQGGGA